ncbi:3-methyladenine DNA glycosylase AlkC [Chitinophaga eiseniae]|uniref:3-methyladenine DNA glycosylase AlkC n=1 Tax=Chitinophaga eiseniae TaxID=634771 RepID=A0A1T4U4W2_9BACT|nr:DNA alkylation repair protein [Chitinophaga eiseniae]SKA47706.1 3-methyladenine DNA glycosylase AlkC [Chitinophaga eiseniae]
MEPLKEMFNRDFYRHFADVFAAADKKFDRNGFYKDVTDQLETRELNGRLRHTAMMLGKHLPGDYKKAVAVLQKAAPSLKTGYTALVLPDFVALYGKDHFDLSMEVLQYFTTLGSAEFAIREFLKADFARTLTVMKKWARHDDHHVRRLASEGSRPRLPWSFKLDAVIKDPSLTRDILESLKTDETLYVRKSVANHLNDISKDNSAYMLQLVKGWDTQHPHTGWIIKHASRTLIKKGDKDSLSVFNFEKQVKIKLAQFKLSAAVIRLGDALTFTFQLKSEKTSPQKLVIDYVVHYPKSSGELSQKVFKLKELTLQPGELLSFSKKQVFKDMTTRKHYAGKHLISIQVNGKIYGEQAFQLKIMS